MCQHQGNCFQICKFAHHHIFKLIIMAKAASKNAKIKDTKAAADAKNWTKVIRSMRSPKTGAYTFKEQIVHKDKIKEFLAN
jgi:Domain of unknown function (DUF4295)